jgi:hypothetical protein
MISTIAASATIVQANILPIGPPHAQFLLLNVILLGITWAPWLGTFARYSRHGRLPAPPEDRKRLHRPTDGDPIIPAELYGVVVGSQASLRPEFPGILTRPKAAFLGYRLRGRGNQELKRRRVFAV